MMRVNGSRISIWQVLLLESGARDFLNRGCTPPVRAVLYGYADSLSRAAGDWNGEAFDTEPIYLNRMDALKSACLGAVVRNNACVDDVWTALYLSGFLTTDMTEEPGNSVRSRVRRLPNNELRQALRLLFEY
ncbi:MAG: hypothetical protein ACLU0O_12640 [Collinsella sp.]